MELLSLVANIMQIVSFVPFAAGAVYFFIRGRQLERRLRLLAQARSERPAALAIGLGASNEGAVRQHLKDAGMDLSPLAVTREGFVRPADFQNVLRQVKDLKDRLSETGVTEVSLFYQGPVTFAVALGAVLHNWAPVKVFGFRDGRYVLDLVLTQQTVISP